MPARTTVKLQDAFRSVVHPLTGAASDYDTLIKQIGDARFILLGEMSHGTHEFYRERAIITRRLVAEKGFRTVAVEADWPDALRVNRYVQTQNADRNVNDALSDFQRFPTWMWRNSDVLQFVGWLRQYNDSLPESAPKAGFYGLDLYSLFHSIESVLKYLDQVDPEAARRARYRYSCFDHYGEDAQTYGYSAGFNLASYCEDEVVAQLLEVRKNAAEHAARDGMVAEDDYFFAEQNARLLKNAENYYRSMFHGRVSSWNLRDEHMFETLEALVLHQTRQKRGDKAIVWAHNSHLGDARATDMGKMGELNLGQIVRSKYGSDAVLIGFSSYQGTVTAASNWGAYAERKRMRPALPESYESIFHDLGIPNFLMFLNQKNDAVEQLRTERLQRAIGVIYLPATERVSHYFSAQLPSQFDVLLHFDETRAVEPLERLQQWDLGETPETYPTGF